VEDSVPDTVERSLPAIDLIGHDSAGVICLEHTLTETYERQILDNRRAAAVRDLFDQRFTDGLEGPGRYTLALQTGGLAELRRKDLEGTVNALERWTRDQRLPVPSVPPSEPNHVIGYPPDPPIGVTLFRFRCMPEDDGKVVLVFQRDEAIDDQRLSRIRKAFLEKSPKLEAARTPGAVTALVLEHGDYVLSNPWIVARAAYSVACAVEISLPDAIVIVDTSAGEGAWMDYLVKFGPWWSNAATDEGV